MEPLDFAYKPIRKFGKYKKRHSDQSIKNVCLPAFHGLQGKGFL